MPAIYDAVGRRKNAVARVRLLPGQGKFTVNRREFEAYFVLPSLRQTAEMPLVKSERRSAYDVIANVIGGGPSGQAGAVRHAIARCLEKAEPELRAALKKGGWLTRDPRMVERKKPGRPGARRSFQFSKR